MKMHKDYKYDAHGKQIVPGFYLHQEHSKSAAHLLIRVIYAGGFLWYSPKGALLSDYFHKLCDSDIDANQWLRVDNLGVSPNE